MCGICGFIDFKSQSDVDVLARMNATQHHRGPDDNGTDVSTFLQASVGLGHARLSILDLTPAGHQPMNYGNLSIVLNGEIYNFREIRKVLMDRGHIFKSESDTEVVLHAFAEWDTHCISLFIGMFAFAIYDKLAGKLFLCRDRAGVKPLYYHWAQDLFLFGSELKSICRNPGFSRRIDMLAAG
jgi:asparagine synthase (glutamine-hydrolysing)